MAGSKSTHLRLEVVTGILDGSVRGRNYFIHTHFVTPPNSNLTVFPGTYHLGKPVLDPQLGRVSIAVGGAINSAHMAASGDASTLGGRSSASGGVKHSTSMGTEEQYLALLNGFLLPEGSDGLFQAGILLIGATLGDAVYIVPSENDLFALIGLLDDLDQAGQATLEVIGYQMLTGMGQIGNLAAMA